MSPSTIQDWRCDLLRGDRFGDSWLALLLLYLPNLEALDIGLDTTGRNIDHCDRSDRRLWSLRTLSSTRAATPLACTAPSATTKTQVIRHPRPGVSDHSLLWMNEVCDLLDAVGSDKSRRDSLSSLVIRDLQITAREPSKSAYCKLTRLELHDCFSNEQDTSLALCKIQAPVITLIIMNRNMDREYIFASSPIPLGYRHSPSSNTMPLRIIRFTLRNFRNTLEKLAIHRQMTQGQWSDRTPLCLVSLQKLRRLHIHGWYFSLDQSGLLPDFKKHLPPSLEELWITNIHNNHNGNLIAPLSVRRDAHHHLKRIMLDIREVYTPHKRDLSFVEDLSKKDTKFAIWSPRSHVSPCSKVWNNLTGRYVRPDCKCGYEGGRRRVETDFDDEDRYHTRILTSPEAPVEDWNRRELFHM
ncbi:hypothetical protein KVT40_007214 [Elsinoe batatas]|uniref:Uncharacterized protein n=1 Tax=Elsinoe batatas TaxID=2601811 RepID=A0A8K0L469_9PEZI|nr:hypothetical protein KVT40_007214 [Elsinoe batatas]